MDKNNKDIEQRSSFEETNTHIGSCGSAHIDDPHSAILVDRWSEIYNSKAIAKTNEGILCGNVVAEYNDNIVLIDFAVFEFARISSSKINNRTVRWRIFVFDYFSQCINVIRILVSSNLN